MRKIDSILFKKTFDLKNSKVYGGRTGETYIECSSATQRASCTDVQTTTQNDKGAVLSSCTEYTCP